MSCIFGSVGSSLGIVLISPPLLTLSIEQPKLLTKCLMPIVMSGVVAVYGLIVSVVLLGSIPSPFADKSSPGGVSRTYSLYSSQTHLFAGMLCGLTAAAAGWCIGIVGRAFVGTLCWHTGGEDVKQSISGGRGGRNVDERSGLLANDGMAEKRYSPPQSENESHAPAPHHEANGRGFNAVYSGMLVTCIFAEAIALYGMITAIIVAGKGGDGTIGGCA